MPDDDDAVIHVHLTDLDNEPIGDVLSDRLRQKRGLSRSGAVPAGQIGPVIFALASVIRVGDGAHDPVESGESIRRW